MDSNIGRYRDGLIVPGALTIIRTDLKEPESWMLQLCRQVSSTAAYAFSGEKKEMFFRLRYTPPYENFLELRRLILSAKAAAGLRAYYRGIVLLDATEWLGHSHEEYFSIIMKYLYDHRWYWYAGMVLQMPTDRELKYFVDSCAAYMTPYVVNRSLFADRKLLSAHMQQLCAASGCVLDDSCAELLAAELQNPCYRNIRSLVFLERVVEELTSWREHNPDHNMVNAYLSHSKALSPFRLHKSKMKPERGGDIDGQIQL